jgi:predicted DNA-binding protein (MmcQ/YjbR family)
MYLNRIIEYMIKKHWNTVKLEGSLQDSLVKEMITHSYELVLASLPRKAQETVKGGEDTF